MAFRPFALFVEDDEKPSLREYADNLGQARRKAQELADREGSPIFVFSFRHGRQIYRFEPTTKKPPQA